MKIGIRKKKLYFANKYRSLSNRVWIRSRKFKRLKPSQRKATWFRHNKCIARACHISTDDDNQCFKSPPLPDLDIDDDGYINVDLNFN